MLILRVFYRDARGTVVDTQWVVVERAIVLDAPDAVGVGVAAVFGSVVIGALLGGLLLIRFAREEHRGRVIS